MNKLSIMAIVIVIVIAGGTWAVVNKAADKTTPKTSSQSKTTTASGSNQKTVTDACSVFTKADAQAVLGGTIKQDSTVAGQTATADIAVSSCDYSQVLPSDASAADLKNATSATVLIRSPKSDAGVQSNAVQFGSGKPPGVQTVQGYGQSAFWNPEFEQLNVLQDNNWVIISSGSSDITARTLADAKKLADVVIPQL